MEEGTEVEKEEEDDEVKFKVEVLLALPVEKRN